MNKVVTFGEIMLRLSTERHLRFSQAKTYTATYGGGEFNVAVSLANYGVPAEFVTRIPDNDIGACARGEMIKRKVMNANVVLGGQRLGIYFLETGAGTRGSKVVYDRSNSSMAEITTGMVNWEQVFEGATLFHWSGVTPAISQSAADVCLEALKVAKKMGITISSDLNYRSKLWNYGKNPNEIMPQLLAYGDIILGDLDTAFFMLGKEKIEPNYSDLETLPGLYEELFKLIPNLKTVATTLRYSVSASHQQIGGVLYSDKQLYSAEVRDVTPVVDRVGSGDAFMGGLLYGLLNENFDMQQSLNFAVAACCLKHTIYGDYNLCTVEEVDNMAKGNLTGKVLR